MVDTELEQKGNCEVKTAIGLPGVSEIAANVPKVSEIAANIPKVFESAANIPKVSESAANIPKMSENAANIPKGSEKNSRISKLLDRSIFSKRNLKKSQISIKQENSHETRNEEKKSSVSKVRQHLAKFLETSGVGGLSHLYTSRTWCTRIIWLIFLLTFWIVTIWQVVLAFMEFLEYPVLVTTNEVNDPNIGFPFVTFCNLNPIKHTKVQAMFSDDQIKNITNLSDDGIMPSIDFEDIFYPTYFEKRVKFEQTGHLLKETLIFAKFQGKLISSEQFITWPHPKYGVCFTFSSSLVPKDILNQNSAGQVHGLEIVLATQPHLYFYPLTMKTGFRVLVSRNYSLPNPELNGVDVAPFTETQFVIKSKLYSQQPAPYSKCIINRDENNNMIQMDKIGNLFQVFWNKYFHNSLSFDKGTCEVNCAQKILYTFYHCVDAEVVHHLAANFTWNANNSNTYLIPSPCNLNTKSQRDNDESVLAAGCQDICPSACYNYQVWPLVATSPLMSRNNIYVSRQLWMNYLLLFEDSQGSLASFLVQSMKSKAGKYENMKERNLTVLLQDPEMLYEAIKANFVRLKVYFSDLNYISIVEQPKHTIDSFMGDLGGILGLWIGLCGVTLIELLELMIDLCFLREKKKN